MATRRGRPQRQGPTQTAAKKKAANMPKKAPARKQKTPARKQVESQGLGVSKAKSGKSNPAKAVSKSVQRTHSPDRGDYIVGGIVGGTMLGATAYGVPGAVVGGIIGLLISSITSGGK